MKDICVFFAEGYEEIEALTVVDILRRAQLPVKMVSTTNNQVVTGAHGIGVCMDIPFSAVKFDEVEMIVLPGGMPGTKNLEAFAPLMEQVDAFDKAKRPISAICAAPSIFGHKGILQGKRACIYPGMEEHLLGAEVVFESSVTDGHITTGRGMGAAIDFACSILERYQGAAAAAEMKKKIVAQ